MKIVFLTLLLLSNLYSHSSNYFQQKVSYKIDVELLPTAKKLIISSKVFYQNNSPDQINEIYFHLYWNLFKKDSYAKKLGKLRKEYTRQTTTGVKISLVEVEQSNQNYKANHTVDNTILKVPLTKPLNTNDTLQIKIDMEAEIPLEGVRMGYKDRYFSIAHWYPSVCVYDRKGWHIDQYLETGEFKEEIADYEVNITLPKTFLVFHSGELINPEETLTYDIRQKLEQAKNSNKIIEIFKPTNKIEIQDNIKQTWKIRARNIRTFAFSAYEDYLWDACSVNNILVHMVYPKQLKDFYKTDGMKAGLHAIKSLSEKIGPYVYSQMFVTVGGTSGGMEYSGIVFMGRNQGGGIFSKINAGVIIHEICHSWFPMMINSDEVDYAFMDEGFTTFFTTLLVEELYGKEFNFISVGNSIDKFFEFPDTRSNDYIQAVQLQKSEFDEPIMTHSDKYESNSVYSINSYPKTSQVLFMLQYVMGEHAFAELWKEYYKRFLFKHVYPEDFFSLTEEIYKKYNGDRNLEWFFDQWFRKTYKLDQELKNLSFKKENGKFVTTIKVSNKGKAIMPADVVIELESGEKKTIWFDVEEFMKGYPLATKVVEFDSRPIRAEINPDKRLLDINRLNNYSDFLSKINFRFDHMFDLFEEPYKYRMYWRPAFWYNDIDKIKVGLNLRGNYLFDQKQFEINLLHSVIANKITFGVDLTLKDEFKFLGNSAYGVLNYFDYEGRKGLNLEVNKSFSKNFKKDPVFYYRISFNYFVPYDSRYFVDIFQYEHFQDQSVKILINNKKFYSITQNFTYKNSWKNFATKFEINFESGFVENLSINSTNFIDPQNFNHLINTKNQKEFDSFNKLSLTFIQSFVPDNLITSLKLREYFGIGFGLLPPAKEFYLARVNPIEEFFLPLYRTTGILSQEFRNRHTAPMGGGFVRGYFNDTSGGSVIFAFNLEIDLSRSIYKIPVFGKFISLLHPTLFFDAGNLSKDVNHISFNRFLYDYGFSFVLTGNQNFSQFLNYFTLFKKLKINTIRFDFPVFLSHPINNEKKFKFRWLLSFNSALDL